MILHNQDFIGSVCLHFLHQYAGEILNTIPLEYNQIMLIPLSNALKMRAIILWEFHPEKQWTEDMHKMVANTSTCHSYQLSVISLRYSHIVFIIKLSLFWSHTFYKYRDYFPLRIKMPFLKSGDIKIFLHLFDLKSWSYKTHLASSVC
jgi:hypothetical protein